MLNSTLLMITVIFLSMLFGAGTSTDWLRDSLMGNLDSDTFSIIAHIRAPRVITVALAGAALAACGVYSQGLFRNPLASPSILGNDSAAVFAGMVGMSLLPPLSQNFGVPIFAAAGSILITILLILSERRLQKSTAQLLLIGFAVSAIFSGATTLILNVASANPNKSQIMLQWLMGGFTNASWNTAYLLAMVIFLQLLFTKSIAHRLDVFSLGGDIAKSLGIDISKLTIQIALVTGVLIGAVTASAGPLPFVGLLIPHISRFQSGPLHAPLMGTSMLNGASFLLICDLLARTVAGPLELQTGVVTTVIGSPYFLWLLMREKQT